MKSTFYAYMFLPVLFLLSCSEDEQVIARFGAHRITLDEFRNGYLEIIKQPNVFDSPPLREQFLQEMIDRRLLAEEARALGLEQNAGFQLRVVAFREKAMRDVHFQAVIKPKIVYPERDLERVYAFMQEERHLRHLFCTTRREADSLYNLLRRGVSFEMLAEQVFQDTLLSQNGGDLGWVAWQQMEYDLAMVAFNQSIGEYSTPVASSYGYHIFQVVDFRKRPLISEQEYQQQRNHSRLLLESKLGEKVAAAYVKNLMVDKQIRVHPGPLHKVGEALGRVLQRAPASLDQGRTLQLADAETRQLEARLWDVRDEPLAEMDGTPMTVGEFIAALNYIPYEAVHRSYKSALDHALRDRALTLEAAKLGLDRRRDVELKSNLFSEYLLQMALRRKLIEGIQVLQQDVQNHYELNKEKLYHNQPLANVHSIVEQDVRSQKRNSVVGDWLQVKKNKVKVSVDIDPVDEYYEGLKKGKNR